MITSDFFSFLHISWSNRPGIIWNVQNRENRPWQHMSIRYGRGLRIFQLWIWNLTFRVLPSSSQWQWAKSLQWLLSDYADARLTNFRMLYISKQWYFDVAPPVLCASGSSRPPPPKLSGELSSQAPYVTLLHTELGSLVRPIVSAAAADGKTRWHTDFHRRRNIEVFEFFYFFNITIEIARAYGKFSNLKIVEVMCMHLGCISKLS